MHFKCPSFDFNNSTSKPEPKFFSQNFIWKRLIQIFNKIHFNPFVLSVHFMLHESSNYFYTVLCTWLVWMNFCVGCFPLMQNILIWYTHFKGGMSIFKHRSNLMKMILLDQFFILKNNLTTKNLKIDPGIILQLFKIGKI